MNEVIQERRKNEISIGELVSMCSGWMRTC